MKELILKSLNQETQLFMYIGPYVAKLNPSAQYTLNPLEPLKAIVQYRTFNSQNRFWGNYVILYIYKDPPNPIPLTKVLH